MGRRENNIVLDKSKAFAISIVDLYKYLSSQKSELVMSKQVLRSGTSIGANLHEAIEAYSTKEFLTKLYIALKEARETEYWLELLYNTSYIPESYYMALNRSCTEIIKLLISITRTVRDKQPS